MCSTFRSLLRHGVGVMSTADCEWECEEIPMRKSALTASFAAKSIAPLGKELASRYPPQEKTIHYFVIFQFISNRCLQCGRLFLGIPAQLLYFTHFQWVAHAEISFHGGWCSLTRRPHSKTLKMNTTEKDRLRKEFFQPVSSQSTFIQARTHHPMQFDEAHFASSWILLRAKTYGQD